MNILKKLFIVSTLLLLTGNATALTWSPTDVEVATGDVNTIDLSTGGTGVFGIFATGLLPQAGGLAGLSIAAIDKITFSLLADNSWEVTNLAGDSFNLGAMFTFNFAYFDGANWLEELAAVELAPGSSIYDLTWGSEISLRAIDVMPIPAPPAVVLLVSALLALIGFQRYQVN